MIAEALTTPPSVLLVDDTPANLIALEAVLKPLGVDLVSASSGAEALDRFGRAAFALVLLDVQMPDMDGFEVARRLRAMDQGRETPIIFLTAIHRDDGFVRKGYALGAADYVTKPFDPDVLRARVRAFVDLFRQRDELRTKQVALRTRERDEAMRQLVAYERIATAAFESDDLRTFLRKLLDVFLEASEVVDAAAIYLREGDGLRCEAAMGINEEVDAGGRIDFGEGFVGAIAATGTPRMLADAASSPIVKSAWIRARGTRGLFGAPLSVDGEVVGVALIGSRFASEIGDAERRLFTAMTERAAAAIVRHRMRAAEQAARVEADRMKDEILSTITHELRTPLNAILGWTRILRGAQHLDDDTARALAIIERNARAQCRLVDDLLDIGRIASGKLRLAVAPVEVGAFVSAAVEGARPAAEAKRITLRAAVDADGLRVLGDVDRLQQITANLVSNALKFTPDGGHVDVRARREGARVVLSVEDDGCGIAPEFLPYVFDRFRQADGAPSRAHGGLGLGLAIVRHLVELHGGVVRAESGGLGKGARFVVELPVDDDARRSDAPAAPARHAADAPLSGLTIVVVEDDPDGLDLLVLMLEERGARVHAGTSAAEGLALVRALRPDVLVTDIAMPGGDGYALLRDVRALPPDEGGNTTALALTAYARREDAKRALDAGFAAHVAKPIDPDALIAAVARAAGRGAARG